MSLSFSVLMANYNNGKYIKDAINSILAQTYKNWELIIVDDASTDNSVEIVESIARSDHRVKLFINSKNRNCGYAKHRAAKMASGDILGYLDPDDTLEINALEEMKNCHESRPDIGLIYSSHYICDEDLNIKRLAYAAEKIPENENYLTHGKGVTHFATFKRKCYLKTTGINPYFKRAVDQDLYYKLEEVCTLYFLNKPLYKYRIHEGGISTLKNLSKSRYWFVKAKHDAYLRRKSLKHIKNISKKELNAWYSILYVSKASDSLKRKNILKMFCWIILSILKSPIDKYFILKLKTLFLNTRFHKLYKSAISKSFKE